MRALAAVLVLLATAARAQVIIPAPGVTLQASYSVPASVKGPAIVGLHGCGGPYPDRDGQWRALFVAAGHAALFPDSFGSRGLKSQCSVRDRAATPGRERRDDAVAAVQFLAAQPGTPPGGVVVVGWSNGGSTVLAAARQGVMPPGLVRGFVAFYPGCTFHADRADWGPSAPLLIVMGADDDWTPAEPCRRLAARLPGQVTLILYPGAYHDFDAPNRPIRIRTGLAFTANGDGVAHVGTDEPARQAALRDVPAWIAGLAPVSPR